MSTNQNRKQIPAQRKSGISRRDFLKTAGGGIAFLFTIGLSEGVLKAQRRDYPDDFNAYLLIGADGRISCFTGKIEMGQGIVTSFAQMLAEELDVVVDRVDMVMGDTDLCPYDRGTTGSRSTKNFGPPLRKAAATARHHLLEMAAAALAIPAGKLVIDNGTISVRGDRARKVTYAELAGGKAITRNINAEIALKHSSDYTVCGKGMSRTDSRQKVTGAALFASDIRRPGMLYASVVRPPSHKAIVRSVDTSKAKKIPGILIVEEQDLIAVLHEKPDVAQNALSSIEVQYDLDEMPVNNATLFRHLEQSATSSRVITELGNVDVAMQSTELLTKATFYNHYVAHAPLEPHSVTVEINKDDVTVWASTQTPFRVRAVAAQTLAIPEGNIRVMPLFIGGGFGGKKAGLDIRHACRLARITGKPVQLCLSRKEEFFYDAFRPAAVIQARAGTDSTGRILAWDFEHMFTGSRSSEPIYDIPDYRVRAVGTGRGEPGAHPFDTGAWRGPGSNSNVHAMESTVDMLARQANTDPLSFRLQNLSNPRMQRVLRAAAEHSGFSFSKSPSGNGYGIACTDYLNTFVATIAQVEVNRNNGAVSVKRIICAQDMGEIINPLGARMQIEGGLTMGLGYCLGEEIRFDGGRVLTENFDTYDITRFSWTPKIEVVLVDNPDLPPQGCGEPAITTMGAVIANAVHDAIGVRLFTLPMTPERIKLAIQDS